MQSQSRLYIHCLTLSLLPHLRMDLWRTHTQWDREEGKGRGSVCVCVCFLAPRTLPNISKVVTFSLESVAIHVITYYYCIYTTSAATNESKRYWADKWACTLNDITRSPSDLRLQTSKRLYVSSSFPSFYGAYTHPWMYVWVYAREWESVYACVIYSSPFNIIYTRTMCKRQYLAFEIGLTHFAHANWTAKWYLVNQVYYRIATRKKHSLQSKRGVNHVVFKYSSAVGAPNKQQIYEVTFICLSAIFPHSS